MNFLHRELARMTERIAFELREANKLAGCVTIKIRYSDFQTETIQATIGYSGADHILLIKAKELFTKLYKKGQLLRLIGVRYSHLVPGNYQIRLFEDTQEKIKLYQAIDSVKHKYGEQFLIRAAGYTGKRDDKPKIEKALRQFK